ncbi:matrix metalloproteinase-2 isoform X1 [Hydra vulgaris]|uniref:Matrix metalloproteinase-2 isoform X1 n=1 Tax=Hydra vulgaris TaxID=6087 RepID=A0ABM4CNI0_HYDVU
MLLKKSSLSFGFSIVILALANQQDNTDISKYELDYLERLGYYKAPDFESFQDEPVDYENTLKESLQNLQTFAGIPASGILDTPTKELIQTPRCGMPDFSSNTGTLLGSRKRRYTLQGSAWKKTNITWKLLNDNNDGLTRDQVEDVLVEAFSKWEKVSSLNFKKLDLQSSEKVDIEVKFVQNYHQDPYVFDGLGGTLAHAFYPHTNEGLSGDVHFDDAEMFTIGSSTGRNLLWVAVHEIGHSIGLEHSNVKDAIMFPYYRGNKGNDFPLTDDDILGIQTLYGSRKKMPNQPPNNENILKPNKSKSRCPSRIMAAVFDKQSGLTYFFNKDKMYIINEHLSNTDGPYEIKKFFPELDNVDAAYLNKKDQLILFNGTRYYIYASIATRSFIESGSIFNKYKGLKQDIKYIDAIFIWYLNGKTYIFAGKEYYRYDDYSQSMDLSYPREIKKHLVGVPENIDSAFVWKNKVLYIFKDSLFYRTNEKFHILKDYPKPIANVWIQCNADLVFDEVSSGGNRLTRNYYGFICGVIISIGIHFLFF